MNTLYVFDLDGTISNASGRLHHLTEGPKKDWKSFFEEIENDPPFMPMINLVKTIFECSKHGGIDNKIILQTGRPENYRYKTGQWLRSQGLTSSYDVLLMRKENDRRPNIELKMFFLEWIADYYNVGTGSILWFEDAIPVVEALNRQGVLTLSCEHFPANFGNPLSNGSKEIPYA